ncbi:GNAT family N-acetyltransferase [Agrobacterium sp. ES01]|uniref:GNAT family N-acetyltransferase n=1 Tax=Agrobacterium sp. ES01 TaxID=3420714 RepID=UPI003D0FC993
MTLPPARPGLVYREDYFADAAGWQSVKQLLRDVFEVEINPIDLYGGHDRSSIACAWFDEYGRVVANLSAFSLPMMIDGQVRRCGGWQSGAVLPEYRGRGLFRSLIQRMFERCEEAGFESLVLLTDKPTLYTPYEFEVLPQHIFKASVPGDGSREQTRMLDLAIPDDVDLLSRHLDQRIPVSSRFSVCCHSRMFFLNCHLITGVHLTLMERSGVIIGWRKTTDGETELLDIIGPCIPSLADIAQSLSWDEKCIRIGFPPDKIGVENVDIRQDDDDLVLMMRGPIEHRPKRAFRLTPMADF